MTEGKTPGGTRRRVLAQGLAAGALLAGACAPGGGSGTGTTGTTADGGAGGASRAPADVVYMTSWNQERLAALEQGLAIFREKQPQIKVTVAPSPGNDQIGALFAAGSGSGFPVDLRDHRPPALRGGQILDLAGRVRAAKLDLDKDYISSKLERWGSKVFALPHTVSPHAWYYNKSLLKQAGAKDPWDDLKGSWAWPDMLDMAKKTTKVSGGPDDVWGVELDYVRPWYQNSGFVWTNGGKLIDTSASPTEWRRWKYTFSDPRTLEGLQFIYDLVHTHRVAITKEKVAELTRATPNLFAAQRTAMFENSSGQLITQLNAKNVFEWDIAPIPRVRAGGKAGVPLWSGNPTAINKDGKALDQTWELALQMALDDFQNAFSKARVVTAAQVKALSIPGGFETPPPAHVSAFRAAGIENSGSWDYHPAFSECEKVCEGELALAFRQEKSLRQACLDIDTQCNAILARGV